ncbi:MAG: ArnT family glycosyltransferase, partial [Anaerolineae bacterium]
MGVGERLLALLAIQPASDGERIALAGGLGLGALAYGFLALGLTGLLRAPPLVAMLVFSCIAAWPSLRRYPMYWRKLRSALETSGFFDRIAITLVIAMLVLALLRGLAPVTDYDGLMYHLVVPRDYWQAGRIFPYPGESHGNFPLTVDLLYLPPVILALESAAKLIHLGLGVLMGLGVYVLARRVLGSRRGGWLALFVLATTPVLGTVGGYAHTDLGWALFEFLSVFALLRWREEGERRWLVLGGVFAGLGLGSKYLGLPVLGVLGLVVLLDTGFVRSRKGRLFDREAWVRMLGDGLLFGLVAVAVASPWYLKNWLWLGNPLYPLWFGGRGWDAYQAAHLSHLGVRYGPRSGLLGTLLLPWDLFFHSIGYFGPIPFAFPPPLSLLLPLYVLVHRRRVIDLLLLIVALRFATWAISARNARYLMDISPLLSIAVAYLLLQLSRRRILQALCQGILFLMLVANLVWQSALFVQEDPIPVVLGVESREEYLIDHNDPPYRAIRFINQLPPGSKVFFVGNGQSYYVTTEHVADVTHANWGRLIYRHGERPEQL